MAAGPGAETEHGAVQAYYMPHPVVTQLGQPMHLDAADYMGTVGAAMRDAASQLQQSGLNPAVRKGWEKQAAHAQLTSTILKYYEDHPEEARDVTSIDERGAEIMARARFGPAYARTFTTHEKPDPGVNGDGDGGDGDGKSKSKTPAKTATNGDGSNKPVVAPPPADSDVFGTRYNPDVQQPTDQPNQNQDQNQNRNQKVEASKTGDMTQNAPAAPTNYADLDNRIRNVETAIFRNPNNPYSVVTNPYYQDQDTFNAHEGGMVPRRFQEGGQVPPPAPIAAGSGTTNMPAPVAAPPPMDEKALADWQNNVQSGLHPVAPVSAVQKYLKENWDTDINRVTYNVGGGLNGGPSYTAHMKGGGTTTIPVQQLARVAPHLVSSNNLSFGMGVADKANAPAAPDQSGGVWSPFGGQQPFPNANDQTNNQIRALVAQQTANPANLTAQNQGAITPKDDADITTKADQVRSFDEKGNFVAKSGFEHLPVDTSAAGDPNNADDQKNAPRHVGNTTDGTTNFNWFVDPRSVPGRGDLTGIPYYVTNSTPWSQFRHYKTGEEHEVLLPDGQQIKNINDLLHTDTSSNQTNPATGKPYTPQDRIGILQEYNYRTLNKDFDPATQRRIEAIRSNVVNAQNVLDISGGMKPQDWSGISQGLNTAASYKNAWDEAAAIGKRIPLIGGPTKNLIRFGENVLGQYNPKLRELTNAWNGLKLAENNPALDPNEQGVVKTLNLSNSMRTDVTSWLEQQRALLTREISAAMANREKLPRVYLQDASNLRNNLPIPHDPHYPTDKPYGTDIQQHPAAAPSASPSASAQAAQANATPIDVRNMNEAQWRAALRGRPVGTQIIDAGGVKRLTKVIQ